MKKSVVFSAALLFIMSANAEPVNDSIRIDEVVITGSRSSVAPRHLSQTVSVIGRDAIEESNRLSVMPLLAEQVPGMFVTSRSMLGYGVSTGAAGNISMRGLTGSSAQTLVLIDGHPQYAGIFGHPIADVVQASMIERVEVLRGPASILYGSNAMGGVVNLVTRKFAQDGTHTNAHIGAGSFGTVETSLDNTTRYGKFSSTVAGSYSRTDGHRDNMNFEQYAGFAKFGYDINSAWKVSADVDVTRFNASQPGPDYQPLEDADQKITRGMASAMIENNYEKTGGAVSAFYNWGDHWINDGYNPGTAPKTFRFTSFDDMSGISAWQSAQLFEGNRTTVGLDFYRYGGEARNDSLNGKRQVIASEHENELAAYVDFRQNIGSLLTINAGLRADRYMSKGTEFIPQAGLAFHLPAQAELKLSAGKGFRYPIIREMYMFPPQNPNLEPESMWNYEMAFSQNIANLKYGINLFYIDAKNLILTLPRPDGPGKLNQNSGQMTNKGVEAMISYRISKSVNVNANYSLLDMDTPIVGAPKHKAYAGASYDNNGIHVGTGLQYIGGLYSTTDRTEDFLLWNMRASYRLSSILQLWVNLDNILGTKYQINDGYPMPGFNFMAGVNVTF